MSHLLRIALPDVPGSLGAVASAIGGAGANINAIEIVEHAADGVAIDDVIVELTPGVMPDMVVSAVQRLDGVRVLWVARYAAGGNLDLDLEVLESVAAAPDEAGRELADRVPRAFRADWAVVAEMVDGVPLVHHATVGAPDLPAGAADWFPLETGRRMQVDSWPSWEDAHVAAAPFGSPRRLVAFGRHGGPEILDSELARLHHLAALTANIESTAARAERG